VSIGNSGERYKMSGDVKDNYRGEHRKGQSGRGEVIRGRKSWEVM
jgi:hypothetical protein